MTNLFVIGNGFDLAHGLKTSYEDFKLYLMEQVADIVEYELVVPEGTEYPDGDIVYNASEVISMLLFLINEAELASKYTSKEGKDFIGFEIETKWMDVETSLGNLDFDMVFDNISETEDDEWAVAANNSALADNLIKPVSMLLEYFTEWINLITVHAIKPKVDFNKRIHKKDQFLTFNYTETLEVVYKIKQENICHIHGKQNQSIILGHGKRDNYTETISNIGSADGLNEIHNILRKDTDKCLRDNFKFFENLSNCNVSKIYSYGFSFNDVDAVYLREICEKIDTEKVTWYFNDYNLSEVHQNVLEEELRSYGFQGNYGTYSVNL